ncbi:paeninodin family lasso peptide [Paenibacillus spiritus]|uniref:Paeninodin family lasso peptide n=1 Tax=Paenibacillus spiritus TaxID=2496557 RepID=A0A5J5FVP1_9BACL|nr:MULTISPECIES: paeninodin family lasso peptide [Paenibacillus]KAA8997575.1 paeninodin family lasso peptide [Paenibacillus spiritus]
MTKKAWQKPRVEELKVSATEYGTKIKVNPDAQFADGKGNIFYSFS